MIFGCVHDFESYWCQRITVSKMTFYFSVCRHLLLACQDITYLNINVCRIYFQIHDVVHLYVIYCSLLFFI